MLGGIIPDPQQLTKRSIMAAVTVPEGFIMLLIAVFFDAFSLFLFILDFAFGIGIPITWMITIASALTLGSWVSTRSAFRVLAERAIQKTSGQMLNVGEGLEGSKNFQGEKNQADKIANTGKNVAKTGVSFGISAVRFVIYLITKIIPFLNNLIPSCTLLVIFELVQGEVSEI
jgi:hypothetical protein